MLGQCFCVTKLFPGRGDFPGKLNPLSWRNLCFAVSIKGMCKKKGNWARRRETGEVLRTIVQINPSENFPFIAEKGLIENRTIVSFTPNP